MLCLIIFWMIEWNEHVRDIPVISFSNMSGPHAEDSQMSFPVEPSLIFMDILLIVEKETKREWQKERGREIDRRRGRDSRREREKETGRHTHTQQERERKQERETHTQQKRERKQERKRKQDGKKYISGKVSIISNVRGTIRCLFEVTWRQRSLQQSEKLFRLALIRSRNCEYSIKKYWICHCSLIPTLIKSVIIHFLAIAEEQMKNICRIMI